MDSAQLALSVVGVVGVFIGLVYAGVQLHDSRLSARSASLSARGAFLLELDKAFVRHEATHRRLRGGAWAEPGRGPVSAGEWADVEAYMGLLERVEVLIEGGQLDTPLVDRLYGYRVVNIVANEQIRQSKLIEEASGWKDFFKLMVRLEGEGRRFEWSPLPK